MDRRAAFFISEAFRALRRSAAPSVAAIVTIVVTTLLLGVLVPVLKASEDKAQDVRDQIGLNVFLYNDAARGEIDQLGSELATIPHVENVDFVSRKEAVEVLSGRVEGELSEIARRAQLESAAAVVRARHRRSRQSRRRHRRDHQDRPRRRPPADQPDRRRGQGRPSGRFEDHPRDRRRQADPDRPHDPAPSWPR